MMSAQGKQYLPQPRPTVARIVFALTLGTAIAVGLYLWVGRMDPTPPWINIPTNATMVASKMNPGGMDKPGAVQYYLQIKVPGNDVKWELERFAMTLDGVQWRPEDSKMEERAALPTRAMTKDDAYTRAVYPKWVQQYLVTGKPMDGAFELRSAGGMEQIDLFGWPGGPDKCIIELVWKTAGLSEQIEYSPEFMAPE